MGCPEEKYNVPYRGERLHRIAFPLGGIGAGMICLEGTGALSHVSLRHRPEVYHEPLMFSALYVEGVPPARVLEGPAPLWKAFGPSGSGNGLAGKSYGLPRFAQASFTARFPFGLVALEEPTLPLAVEITGWSPFIPGQADDSSLPVAALEYCFQNISSQPAKAVYSFHAAHFLRSREDSGASVQPRKGGFALIQPPVADQPWEEGALVAFVPDAEVAVDCAWFRGRWFDPLTMVWNAVASGQVLSRPPHAEGPSGNGGSLYVPFTLEPGQSLTLRLLLAWYVPRSNLRVGADTAKSGGGAGTEPGPSPAYYVPWYAGRFDSLEAVADYWERNYGRLRQASRTFSDCFYDTTLPPEAVEAVAANLSILKSPTCLRQADGRLWCWEGCSDSHGCCHGSCTHVWNYAQAIPHLFPSLERSLRETEFRVNQDERGHQNFRASLPIREPDHGFHAAADGQLGGIIKAYREWRISGDTAWMKSLWLQIQRSLDYCIATWDPDHTGTLIEPHHNTYDIEFWGADGMCTSIYLAALQAACRMGQECGADVSRYEQLLERGRQAMETDLWNGEYFIQKVQWIGLHAPDPSASPAWNTSYSSEAREILQREGPKYQYGNGCLSDGVLGDWLARVSGVEPVLDPDKVTQHLLSVFKYNYRPNLSDHANPQRPGYALGQEGGLLLCSWPRGDKPSLPFVYSDEVWTGIEYQVASHLILMGHVEEGLQIVRTVRDRYDGRYRNPFDEYECGHWYGRALSSYGLLQALSGARYDAVEKTLYLKPAVEGDFRAFLCTATGFGVVGLRDGQPFWEEKWGTLDIHQILLATGK